MSDFTLLMTERLTRFENFLNLITEKSEDATPPKSGRGVVAWKTNHTSREDVNFFLNQAKWFSHLVPGWKQCITDEHRTRLGAITDTFAQFNNSLTGEEFEPCKAILLKIFHGFQHNRWVNGILRDDQLPVAQQNRYYLSCQLTDYATTYFNTQDAFSGANDTLDFYLNNPIFQQDLNNANLVDSPTGTGKTRISMVSNLGQFSWSNEELPFASRRLAVFVRTRSQTQAFLKEAKRLDLSVGCPISVGLGCQSHNDANHKFLDAVLSWASWISGSIKNMMPNPLPGVPLELFTVSVQSEDDSLKDFAAKVRDLFPFTHRYDAKQFLKEVTPDLKNFFRGLNRESAVFQQAHRYLTETPNKCSRCFSNVAFVRKQAREDSEAFEQELNDLCKDPASKSYFFKSDHGKNADINQLARGFQESYGHCGRGDSIRNLKTVDVIIFTYNWLLDFSIRENQTTRILENKGTLDADTAVICDEGHFLFSYNQSNQFDIASTLQHVKKLISWKMKFQFPEYKIPGAGAKVENPLASNEFSTLQLEDEEFLDRNIGKVTHSVLKALRGILKLQTTFGQMPNVDQSPKVFYTLVTNKASSGYPKDLFTSLGGIKLKDDGNDLEKLFDLVQKYTKRFYGLKVALDASASVRQDEIESMALKGVAPTSRWLSNVYASWVGAGKKNPGKFANALIHVAADPFAELGAAVGYILNFLVLVQENLYAESSNLSTKRMLAITSGGTNSEIYGMADLLKPRFMDDFSEDGVAKEFKPFLETVHTALYKPPKNIFKEPMKVAMDCKALASTMKVNRPLIQTALRGFGYITILTGTPPDNTLWRSKSGFKYLSVSKYGLVNNPFTFEFVNDYELKFETRSVDLYKKIANDIMTRTKDCITLVGYPSGLILKNIVEQMPETYRNSVMIESPTMSLDDVQKYVETHTSGAIHVVLAGRLVEGVEFSDESGSSLIKKVIIVGVPFNPPSEEQKQIDSYYMETFGWDKWDVMRAFMYGPVYVKIRQAIGRSVRNLTDRATVVFLDSRFQNSKMLRQALKLF
jgi:Rad3-related DNA helicase